MAISVLICETDIRDPYTQGLVADEQHPGPLLSLLQAEHYDALTLLHDERGRADCEKIQAAVGERYPDLPLSTTSFSDFHPGDYTRLYRRLQSVVDEVRARYPESRLTVSLTSGQPEVHVAWMQVASQYPCIRLVQIEPPLAPTTLLPRVEVVKSGPCPGAPVLREDPPRMMEDLAGDLDLVGDHPVFLRTLDHAYTLGGLSVPVLLVGEPGTGKSLLAQFVHEAGPRRRAPFITADLDGMADFVATSAIFGNRENTYGSPSGSGKLSLAKNGTLLIENLDRLHKGLQKALLDYLNTGQFRLVGGHETFAAQARLVFSVTTSSDRNLQLLPELAQKLEPTTVRVPPLRERRSDIVQIALHYLKRLNTSLRRPRTFSHQAIDGIQFLNWPANVRDLRTAVERAALLSGSREISLDELRGEMLLSEAPAAASIPLPELQEGFSLEGYLGEVRRRLLLRALELSKGNQSEAARMLNITPQAVHQFLKMQLRKRD